MTTIQRISPSRRFKDRLVQFLVYLSFAIAVVPLVAVLWMVIKNGLARFDLDFLTHSMRNIGATDAGGGAYHAIIGTLEQVLLASVISVPIGLLTAIYLVEYGQGTRLSRAISFFSAGNFLSILEGSLSTENSVTVPSLRTRLSAPPPFSNTL